MDGPTTPHFRPSSRWPIVVGLVSALAAPFIAPATGSAASATLTTGSAAGGRVIVSNFDFSAGPGEANDLTLGIEGDSFVVRDVGAVIVAGQGCTQTGPNEARCQIMSGPGGGDVG